MKGVIISQKELIYKPSSVINRKALSVHISPLISQLSTNNVGTILILGKDEQEESQKVRVIGCGADATLSHT